MAAGAASSVGADVDFEAGGLATATGISDELELRFFFFMVFAKSSTVAGSVASGIAADGFVSSMPLGRAGEGADGVVVRGTEGAGTV